MFSILGRSRDQATGFCDGLSRRDFLTVGGMACGGLSLAQMLAADKQSGTGSNHRAIINVYMPGGPSHIDLWDLKPNAPKEIRGDFRPIETNVPGIYAIGSLVGYPLIKQALNQGFEVVE